jgi:hypothetical protein
VPISPSVKVPFLREASGGFGRSWTLTVRSVAG